MNSGEQQGEQRKPFQDKVGQLMKNCEQLMNNEMINELAVREQLKEQEELSVSGMARRLEPLHGISRSKLQRLLSANNRYEWFKSQGRRITEKNAIVYTRSVWEEVLGDIGISYPEDPKALVERHESTLTVSVVEAEFVDPMDEYMASALAFSDGAKPLAHRDTSLDVTQLQALAANATTAMNDFTNLLTEEEIQEAINRGAKRGAMKAALERQSEVKVYEASMGGKARWRAIAAICLIAGLLLCVGYVYLPRIVPVNVQIGE